MLSDRGIGITGQLCFFRACEDVGAGMNWRDFPAVRYIGADVNQFVTASRARAAAAGSSRVIVVRPGRPFLFVDADGPDGARPGFQVRAPNGRIYSTRAAKVDSRVVRDRALGFTGLTIARPRPGRWTVIPVGSAKQGTTFVSQVVHKIKRVRVTRVAPAGTRRKPISRRGGAPVRVSWKSLGLAPSAKVNVYVTPSTRQLGRFIAGGKRARAGFVRIPRSRLSAGVNRVRLVVLDKGIAVDDVFADTLVRAR